MEEVIKRIAELQPHYSPKKTPEMDERGVLVRKDLLEELRDYLPDFRERMGDSQQDIQVQASDGRGNKTPAPWVRIHSKALSPSATEGYYIVLHFSCDGERFYITMGCGSQSWDLESGTLSPRSDEEIDKAVLWALEAIESASLEASSFPDQINFSSTRTTPLGYERATVFAREFSPSSFIKEDVINSIFNSLDLLKVVYEAYTKGENLTSSEIQVSEVENTVNPTRATKSARQGFRQSADERRAIEIRAMVVTRAYLEEEGYKVKDTSANNPFDLLAKKTGSEVKVEVKGTTATVTDAVLMTANEVTLHMNEDENTALAIVSGIKLRNHEGFVLADGGDLEYCHPWAIQEWEVKPITYQVKRKC
ncbi:MAG: DUF3578 domain-containing protein [Halioglobus sp.]